MTSLLSFLVFAGFLLGALFIHHQNAFADPPPWAPAYGYREKHKHEYDYDEEHEHKHKHKNKVQYEYYYYPTQQVYYYPQTQKYFWLQAGNWSVGYKLPDFMKLGSPVTLDLDTEKPYTQHSWIKQKYPGN